MLVPEKDVYLMPGYTDMRKAINGLSSLVAGTEGVEVFSGGYFVFCNRTRQIIKILYWERNGFCLWQKRLDKQRFKWPKDASEVSEITAQQLRWLLEGLSPEKVKAHRAIQYNSLL